MGEIVNSCRFCIASIFLCFSLSSFAIILHNPKGFSGDVSLAFSANSGNSDSKNISTGLNLKYKPNDTWVNKLSLQGQINSADGQQTAKKYTVNGETNYFLSKRNFIYGTIFSRQDKFSPFTYEVNESVGYGRRVFEWHKMTLDGKIGPGLRQARARDTGEKNIEKTIYGSFDYEWKITDATTFTQSLTVTTGHPNTHLESVSAVHTKIIGNLGMQVSYTIDHDSYIPPGSLYTKRTDTTTNIAIVYSFT